MKCPVCTDSVLTMAERQGVEIDYCPNCRGVWLDRGELDKLIAKSAVQEPDTQSSASVPPRQVTRPDFVDSDYKQQQQRGQPGYHRKKSWLSDIFD